MHAHAQALRGANVRQHPAFWLPPDLHQNGSCTYCTNVLYFSYPQSEYVGEVLSCHVTTMRDGALERPSSRTWQRDASLGANTLTIANGHVIDVLRWYTRASMHYLVLSLEAADVSEPQTDSAFYSAVQSLPASQPDPSMAAWWNIRPTGPPTRISSPIRAPISDGDRRTPWRCSNQSTRIGSSYRPARPSGDQ